LGICKKIILVKYFLYLLSAGVILAVLFLWDASQRYDNIAFCPDAKEISAFTTGKPGDSLKNIYETHFFDKRFSFPRQTVRKVKITKNIPLIGRFLTTSLSKQQQKELIKFLNNPDNFTWKKVNMRHSDADYILYFYNDKKQAVGKIWFCAECGQLIAVPFSPNMKFGSIKASKLSEMLQMITR